MSLFTVEEANALLPKIKPRVAELLAIRERIRHRQPALTPLINEESRSNGGNQAASDTAADMERFNRLVAEINSYGCLLKDVNQGLVDFLAEIDGRVVYLCWQHGEEEVAWWHELEAGYAGRQRVP